MVFGLGMGEFAAGDATSAYAIKLPMTCRDACGPTILWPSWTTAADSGKTGTG